ncbi:MAG: hypothetical protein NTZ95_04475 [Candidatus Omnitrophica bacterium]|nr:hypothetical protein [Candidatus Omnitrophota bacterium]
MRCRSITHIAVFLILTAGVSTGFAETSNTFNTKYTTIYYKDDKDLSDFLWRLGGTRLDFSGDKDMASNRVDRIVERVETIIDMRPKDLHIDVYLQRGDLKYNEIAFYQHKTCAVYLSVDKVSDGVFAHEISHAIVNRYFTTPAPSKIQEIISQYVDRYLWSDY